jgi:hypothetical protein
MQKFLRQRLSYREKTTNDFEWAKRVTDYILTDFSSTISRPYSEEYKRKLVNYQLYNDIVNQADFEKECNPLGLQVDSFKEEIKAYNKAANKINSLLSDEMTRAFDWKIVLTDTAGIRSKLLYKDKLVQQFVLNSLQTAIQAVTETFGKEMIDPEIPIVDPSEADKYMSSKYLDKREIAANKLLSYYYRMLNIPIIKNDGFKHGLIAGEEFAYVTYVENAPIIQVLNPLGMIYYKSPDVKYIQDGTYAGYKTYMTLSDVLDTYQDYLSDEQVEELQSKFSSSGSSLKWENHMKYNYDNYLASFNQGNTEGQYSSGNDINMVAVQHVEWKTQKKVGFLTFVNEFGEEEIEIVAEEYPVPKNAQKEVVTEAFNRKCEYYYWMDPITKSPFKIKYSWIDEVWETTKIGRSVYCKIGPKEIQFRSMDNPTKVKLGYHGTTYSSMNARPVSVMDRMKPFLYLYFIVSNKLRKLIAQDKGPIYHFDTSMVDPQIGLEKTLYYLTELNIDFFNPLQNAQQPGAAQRGKIAGVTNMSTASDINNYIMLLQDIDQQLSDVSGVAREREGRIASDQAVTNAQSNANNSSLVTEVYHSTHEKLWEEILNSFIQIAQFTIKNKSVIKQAILDDGSIQVLELTPDDVVNSDFGLFVSNNYQDVKKFEKLENLSLSLLQSDRASFSDIIKMFDANSIASLKAEIIHSEEARNKNDQAQSQAQMQSNAEQLAAARQHEIILKNMELEAKIKVAEIQSFSFVKDQDSNDNGIPDQFEVEKWQKEVELKERKLDLEEKAIKLRNKPAK